MPYLLVGFRIEYYIIIGTGSLGTVLIKIGKKHVNIAKLT